MYYIVYEVLAEQIFVSNYQVHRMMKTYFCKLILQFAKPMQRTKLLLKMRELLEGLEGQIQGCYSNNPSNATHTTTIKDARKNQTKPGHQLCIRTFYVNLTICIGNNLLFHTNTC